MRVDVHFHDMDPSAAVETAVREHAAKLEFHRPNCELPRDGPAAP